MNWNFPYPSTRVPLLADNCVATSQPLASQAGPAMLRQGGSAVDAALAAAIALTVVEPVMNGIGGDAFAIVADKGRLHGLNASGRAPRGWSPRALRGPRRHAGARLGFGHRARRGFRLGGAAREIRPLAVRGPVRARDPLCARRLSRHARDRAHVGRAGAELARFRRMVARRSCIDGKPPAPGQRFRYRDQAETLEEIAATKGASFYRGALAERIAAAARAEGGAMTADDLAEHRADWVEPLGVDFKGYRIHELPPNGQGVAALIALGILDRLDIEGLDPDSAAIAASDDRGDQARHGRRARRMSPIPRRCGSAPRT